MKRIKNKKELTRISTISKRMAPIRNKILFHYGRKCAICGWTIENDMSGGCDIHHIIQVSDGGDESFENLILLCPNCHRKVHRGCYAENELRRFQTKDSKKSDVIRRIFKKISAEFDRNETLSEIDKKSNKKIKLDVMQLKLF